MENKLMPKAIRVSWRAIILFVLVWFIGASILLDFWPFIRSEGKWKTVTNTQYGFSVDYPTKWVARTYDEHGFKGEDEVKLRIYRSLLGVFEIAIRYQEASEPTLAEVVAWGDARITSINRNLVGRGEISYEEVTLWEDIIRGHTVARRVYKREGVMKEDVYIARTNDMIIITLQSEERDFDNYLEDFEAIVVSFKPLD
jgi:hypothetical protein